MGLRPPFAGNAATAWGTRSEPLALEDYYRSTGGAPPPQEHVFKLSHLWVGPTDLSWPHT